MPEPQTITLDNLRAAIATMKTRAQQKPPWAMVLSGDTILGDGLHWGNQIIDGERVKIIKHKGN